MTSFPRISTMALYTRDVQGKFRKSFKGTRKRKKETVIVDHNYCTGNRSDTAIENPDVEQVKLPKSVDKQGWKEGRRIVEFGVLLSKLKYYQKCRLGPVPLTYDNILGELKKGLSGYLYVRCQNDDCGHVNLVPYGKTHRGNSAKSQSGMHCFAVNTKLGTAMIDSLGGPVKVNNMLSTLNMPTISNKNMKKMERWAGNVIEKVALMSTRTAAKETFDKEMA
ncbi:uncharacterized protein LOC128553063 [Mercenaria mercenaria]|uniref:uncharacterized protein LOC128553063 n=1 Tax=Mercenaria mercenaria TaxID=6596 RepID=UPI00234E7E6E|nr:uncharacterized protein LOC128553063 [Mercenaria mercenaria]